MKSKDAERNEHRRILIYAPGADRGGVATVLCSLIRLLESVGHSVNVLVPYDKDILNAAIPRENIVGSVRKRPIRFRLLRRLINLFSLITAYRFSFFGVKKYPHDVFICFFAPGNAYWALYTDKPIVGWFHGCTDLTREKACVSWQETRRTLLMERFYKKFHSLIAITEEVAASYMRRYRIKQPDVIQNLINIDDILFKSNAILPMTMRGEKKLLYCGRMSHDKGLDRLIVVLGRIKKKGIKGWHLTIVGDGDERSENDELVKSNDLSSDVTFVGMVENPYPYMRAADLLICPSRSEGLGLVLWESLICGTSVLATDCGGTRSALRNGEWGRLVNNDEDSLFEGLMEWYGGADFAPNVDFNLVVQDLRNMNEDSEKRLLKVLK